MITVGKLRERLGAYPSDTPVFLVTMRRNLRADIVDGEILVLSSIQPWLVYDSNHGRVTLWEHVALESINGAVKPLVPKEAEPRNIGGWSEPMQQLMDAIGRHPAAENDPAVIDAINAIEDALG